MFTSVQRKLKPKRKLKKRKSPIRSQRRVLSNVTRWAWVGFGVVLVACILLYVLYFAKSSTTRGGRALKGGVYDPGPIHAVAYPVHDNPVHNNSPLETIGAFVIFAVAGSLLLYGIVYTIFFTRKTLN